MDAACISPEDMTRFMAGEMSSEQESDVAQHLERCSRCQELAEDLSDIPNSQGRLAGRQVSAAYAGGTSLKELQGRLQALAIYDGAEELQTEPTASTVRGGNTLGGESADHEKKPPRRLGKFEIIRLLGSGGFSVVYLAKDTSLDRLVALKLPRASILADPDSRRRFFREAQALARLDHPNIVAVYEAGEYDDTCYLAVEFCDGPTLDEWRRQQPGPVNPTVVARMLLALAGAVEHAHEHGIFHRDIKPANVLLSTLQADGDGLPDPRLADFGLARVIDSDRSQPTLSGVVLGTPQYLAPEQAAGMSDRIGPQTDVYALGAVLYELLAGRPPIVGATSIDTLRRVLVDDPPPLREVVRTAPAALEDIVAKCLQKSTEFRYATARELADDLRRFLDGQPVRAASTKGLRDRKKQRRALSAAFLATAAISIIACAAVWFAPSRKATTSETAFNDQLALASISSSASALQPQPEPAATKSDIKIEDYRIVPSWLAKAEGRTANGSALPLNLPAQRMPSMRYQQIYSRSEFDSAGTITAIRFRRDEGELPFSMSGIDARIHLAYAGTSIDDFSTDFARNIGASRTTVLETPNLTLSSHGSGVPRPFDIIIPLTTPFYYDPARGDLLLEVFVRNAVPTAQFDFSGRADQKERVVTRRLFAPAANASTGTVDFAVSPYPAGLATRFDMLLDSDNGLSNRSDERLAVKDSVPRWRSAIELAGEHMAVGRFEIAEPLLRDALQQSRKALGEQHFDALDAESRLGECLARQRNFVEAEQHLLNSHGSWLRISNVTNTTIRNSCERLIQLYDAWGQAQKAAKWRAQWALARRHEVATWPAEPADRAVAMQNLGFYLMKVRDAAAAEEPLRECFVLRFQSLGPQHYGTVSAQNRLGECLAALKRFEEAEVHLLKSYESVTQHSDVPSSWRAYHCLRIVNLYSDWGKSAEVAEWKAQLREDIHREAESLPSAPAERSAALARLGKTLSDYQEFRDAEPLLRECLEIRERATPRHWATYDARSLLGAALLGQQRYEEAEPLLVAGYEGLIARQREIGSANREAPQIALQRVIQLYEQWDRPADAERWKKEANGKTL